MTVLLSWIFPNPENYSSIAAHKRIKRHFPSTAWCGTEFWGTNTFAITNLHRIIWSTSTIAISNPIESSWRDGSTEAKIGTFWTNAHVLLGSRRVLTRNWMSLKHWNQIRSEFDTNMRSVAILSQFCDLIQIPVFHNMFLRKIPPLPRDKAFAKLDLVRLNRIGPHAGDELIPGNWRWTFHSSSSDIGGGRCEFE